MPSLWQNFERHSPQTEAQFIQLFHSFNHKSQYAGGNVVFGETYSFQDRGQF